MLLLSLIAGLALAADPRDALLQAYADQSMSAEHLILVDVGGTGPDELASLKSALASLARGLPAGERLEAIAFSDQVQDILPRTEIADENREAVALALEQAPVQAGLSSDLGLALATARERLRVPGSPDLNLLVVVSDFCHEPAEGSPYAFAGASGCAMLRGSKELKSGFDTVRSERLVLPLALSRGTVDRGGLAAFFKAAGEGRTLAVRADEPLRWVQSYLENLPWRKVEALARREREQYQLSAEVTAVTEDEVAVTLRSGLIRLGVDLDSLQFSKPGLEPVRTAVELRPDAEIRLKIVPPEAPFSPVPSSRTIIFDGQLSATASLSPRAPLSRVGVHTGLGVARLPIRVSWKQPIGPPVWAFSLGIALPALGVLALIRRRIRRRRASSS